LLNEVEGLITVEHDFAHAAVHVRDGARLAHIDLASQNFWKQYAQVGTTEIEGEEGSGLRG